VALPWPLLYVLDYSSLSNEWVEFPLVRILDQFMILRQYPKMSSQTPRSQPPDRILLCRKHCHSAYIYVKYKTSMWSTGVMPSKSQNDLINFDICNSLIILQKSSRQKSPRPFFSSASLCMAPFEVDWSRDSKILSHIWSPHMSICIWCELMNGTMRMRLWSLKQWT
jgi:hypothetical protein